MEIRRREEKFKEAQVLHEYRTKLKENTLETFTDKPEPITELRICNATPSALMFEWDEPHSNNAQICGYQIHIDDKVVATNVLECYYEAHDLQVDTCYKILVVAESDRGEGYKAKVP